jgi:hypothetical protein
VEGTVIAGWDMSVIWWTTTCQWLIFLPLKIRRAIFHLDSRKPAICFMEGVNLSDVKHDKNFYSTKAHSFPKYVPEIVNIK